MSKPKIRKYSYIKLADLKPNTVVDLYGVVKFFKPIAKSRGTDYMQVISIVDPSFHENYYKLVCIIFIKEKKKCIPVEIGSIVRFHRLKIGLHNSQPQGQSGPGFSWVVCDGEDGYNEPKTSSASFTFTDEDKERVKDLYSWSKDISLDEVIEATCIRIEDIALDIYFDLVCQVVSTCVSEAESCFVIKVWDGTKTKCNILQFNNGQFKGGENMKKVSGLTYDVCLFEDHLERAIQKNISTGQFVKLVNVHASLYKGAVDIRSPGTQVLELCLHRGRAYGRGLFVLDENDDSVVNLKKKLEEIVPEDDNVYISVEEDMDVQLLCSSDDATDDTCNQRKEDLLLTTKRKGSNSSGAVVPKKTRPTDGDIGSEKVQDMEMSGSQPNLCMLETVTVIIDHPHTKRIKITDVLEHSVPYKFRVLARVLAIQPSPVTAETLISLYCSKCHHNMKMSDCLKSSRRNIKEMFNRFSDSSTSDNSGQIRVKPKCPQCSENKDNDGSDEGAIEMDFIFMLRLLLYDGAAWLTANIWKAEAVTFLKDITPNDVLSSPKHKADVNAMLLELCPLDKPLNEKPWLDLCLKSYTVGGVVNYQIFDTCIV